MSPDDFRRLVAAGMSTEQIAIVMELMERDSKAMRDADEARRLKARDRVAKWRERHGNVSETSPKVTERLTGGGAPVEDKTSNLEIEPQEQKQGANGDVAAFRARLAPLVDAEVLEEFIKVRRKKRGALTGYAAGLFVEDAAAVDMTPLAAARECVRSSWITVKPHYLPNGPRAGPRINPTLVAARNLMDELNAAPTSEIEGSHPSPRLVAFSGR